MKVYFLVWRGVLRGGDGAVDEIDALEVKFEESFESGGEEGGFGAWVGMEVGVRCGCCRRHNFEACTSETLCGRILYYLVTTSVHLTTSFEKRSLLEQRTFVKWTIGEKQGSSLRSS